MGWPFGLAKKKIAQVPPSQMGTGTPGDPSWLDDIRQERAKLDEKRNAAAAKEAKEREEALTHRTNFFVSLIKAKLPHGVTIVEVFIERNFSPEGGWRSERGRDTPVARIDLGVGVQFDLMYVVPFVSMGEGPAVDDGTPIIDIYEAGGPYGWDRNKHETKLALWNPGERGQGAYIGLDETLFDALEKYHAKRASA